MAFGDSYSTNLKKRPLQPNPFNTNRWNFSGKPLPREELEQLRKNGVTDEDWMVDDEGRWRLKLPKFRRKWVTKEQQAEMKAESDGDLEKLRETYESLPDPKPDYLQWAAEETRKQQFEIVFRTARESVNPATRLKAINTIWEFSKQKPKSVHEVQEPEGEIKEASVDELFNMLLAEMGYDPNAVRQVLSEHGKQVKPS